MQRGISTGIDKQINRTEGREQTEVYPYTVNWFSFLINTPKQPPEENKKFLTMVCEKDGQSAAKEEKLKTLEKIDPSKQAKSLASWNWAFNNKEEGRVIFKMAFSFWSSYNHWFSHFITHYLCNGNDNKRLPKDWFRGICCSSSFTVVSDWKQFKFLSTKESISKLWCFHTMRYYQPKQVVQVQHG